ncbi:translation initiation factor 4B [Aspergillus clavatus NRRL 1]|uniref:Translation initiation factor 4B n=1 Tax=Aspergillus clavatus (strain ATCC 1007 / CBS 513.65 / DSM 816 / NCTC 3887 / NRRL 1 / QM 1276 / 107) TaxID=344612 RepID=A1C7X3_ASPCL|nr:translation initiation factor 4B [Aspergillus clavatus NRRL 1]EAW14494.1 translation initiation factor 4B [Aspergillus clavatus NRRL 1]
MSISTFLADENFGSWADEMEDMPLPAAPPSQSAFGGDRRFGGGSSSAGFGGSSFGGDRERGGYAVREPLPLPTQPPYTAHVGNLSFEATSADISDLFADCSVTNVRIVEDKLTRSPKGFGYVEFETVDGLKKALDLSGTTLQGRAIRVSIAEPLRLAAKERDVKELDWTRKGPLSVPDAPPRRVPDRSSFGRNLDNVSDAGSERAGGRRNFESDGKPRDFGNWERKGPLSPVSGPGPVREGRPRSNEGPGFRKSSPAWGEGRSQDGSRPPRREFQERAPTAAELDNSWRARMRPDQPPAKEPSNPPSPAAAPATLAAAAAPAAPAAPASRPKLNLQKRTVTETPSSPAATADTKASPFGGARPIDTAARERQVEERRQLAIRQKKEADEKAKVEKADKQRQTKEQVKTEKSAPAADSNDKDSAEMPQGGKNFEILRRAGEDENGEAAQAEEAAAPAAGEETSKQAPASKANGNWRSAPAKPAEPTVDEEGWSTVSSRQRNNRRGQSGRPFA